MRTHLVCQDAGAPNPAGKPLRIKDVQARTDAIPDEGAESPVPAGWHLPAGRQGRGCSAARAQGHRRQSPMGQSAESLWPPCGARFPNAPAFFAGQWAERAGARLAAGGRATTFRLGYQPPAASCALRRSGPRIFRRKSATESNPCVVYSLAKRVGTEPLIEDGWEGEGREGGGGAAAGALQGWWVVLVETSACTQGNALWSGSKRDVRKLG